MAVYFQKNEVGFKKTGLTVTIPNNDVARLMYYLSCVCNAIEYEQDAEIRRFTNYDNWASLSINEQKVLIALCITFSPDVLDDKVFFHSDVLCGNSQNEFLEISQVRHQLLAAQSVIIAGQTREVNKIMVYKMQWMANNYLNPMRGLAEKLRRLEQSAITYSSPPTPRYTPNYTSSPSPRIVRQPPAKNRCCTKGCMIGSVCGFLFLLAIAITVVVFVSKNK